MTAQDALFPPLVFTLWRLALVLAYLVFIPLAVYLLHRLLRTARSIQSYAEEALLAAAGIAGNTRNIPALDATITTATEILEAASSVDNKLASIADVMAQRAS